jgi:hypothetical protein
LLNAVPLAVEALVDEILQPLPQRVEQGGDSWRLQNLTISSPIDKLGPD